MQTTINVTWSMTLPPITPQETYIWSLPDPLEQDPIDAALAWPPGTIDILKKAFHKNLHRFISWDMHEVGPLPALSMAATIYKRGVATLPRKTQELQSSYNIDLVNGHCRITHEYCIIDQNVAALWSIEPQQNRLILALDEASKTLSSVGKIAQFLETIPPKSPIYIIGGGVLCDTAAFACALKQIPFILVPSTLLSMADACIGGKTGVNFPPFGKNQVGLFAFPQQVLIYPSWLQTLPPREVRAGTAECLKHAFLDKELFTVLDKLDNSKQLPKFLPNIIGVKARIVAKDPGEQGERATLNLGHTLAHALESISHAHGQQILLHGEAVGLGLVMALYLSHTMGLLTAPRLEQSLNFLKKFHVIPPLSLLQKTIGVSNLSSHDFIEQVYRFILQDKKMTSGDSQWILLKDIGVVARTQQSFTVAVDKTTFTKSYQAMMNDYLRNFSS